MVTPTLNPGARLDRCVQSVRTQDYPNVEHLIIDGGSTDGSLERLRSRGEAGVRVISESDEGQADAIRKGFERARGDVVGWLNADDVLTSGHLRRAVSRLVKSPSSGWVYCPVAIIGPGTEQRLYTPPRRLRHWHFFGGNPVAQPGSLYRREALDQVGNVDAGYQYAMDLDLWVRLLVAGYRGARVDAVGAVFEVHDESKTGSTPRAEFILDQARALFHCGWNRQGGGQLGRAAAISDEDPIVLLDRRRSGLLLPEVNVRAVARSALAGWASEILVMAAKRQLPFQEVRGSSARIWKGAIQDPMAFFSRLAEGARRFLTERFRPRSLTNEGSGSVGRDDPGSWPT